MGDGENRSPFFASKTQINIKNKRKNKSNTMDSNELTNNTHEQNEPIQSVSLTEGVSNNDDIANEPIANDIFDMLDSKSQEITEDEYQDATVELSEIDNSPKIEAKTYSISANIDPQSWAILRGELAGHGLNEQTTFSEYVQILINQRSKAFQKEEIKVAETIMQPKIEQATSPNIVAPPNISNKTFSATKMVWTIIGVALILGFVAWVIWQLRKNAALLQSQTGFFEIA